MSLICFGQERLPSFMENLSMIRATNIGVLSYLLIAMSFFGAAHTCAAEEAAENNDLLDKLSIDLGGQRTYWEDSQVTIRIPGISNDIEPETRLQLTDRDGAVIESLFTGRLIAEGVTRRIEPQHVPPGSYRLRLEAESGDVSKTVNDILVFLPHRNYRTYVATGCYAHMGFGFDEDGRVTRQGRDFEEAHMNTVVYSAQSPSKLDAAAFSGVIGHYLMASGRIGGNGIPIAPDGTDATGRGSFFRACFTNPENREASRKRIEEHCEITGEHPALYGYILQDEVQHAANACYCQFCRKSFSRWLKDRYSSIDQLNEAWSADHTDFESIDPPLPLSLEGRSPKDVDEAVNRYAWYDWLMFKDWSMADYVRDFTTLIHEIDPGKPVANHFIPDFFASNGYHWRDNPFVVQVEADQVQASQWGDRYGIGFHANVESHVGGPAWCTGTNPFVGPTLRWAQVYSGYMHGYQGVMWWFYQPVMAGRIDFGLLEQKPIESRGPRYDRAVQVNQRIRQIAPVLGELPTVRAPVGLVWSDATVIQHPNDEKPIADCFGLYRALNRLQIEPVILLDSQLTMEQLRPLKVVLLAGAWNVSPQSAAVLRDFVSAGGHIIASTNTAYYDHGHTETHALAEVFGAKQGGRTRKAEQLELKRSGEANMPVTYMMFHERSVPLIGYTQAVDVHDAEVLAQAESDYKPLLTRHRYGEGSAVLASFTLGKTCGQEATDVGLELLERLLSYAQVDRAILVRTGPAAALTRDPDVDAILRHREGDKVRYLLAINYGEDERKEYRIRGEFSSVFDVFAQQSIPSVVEDGTTRFTVRQAQHDPQAYALVEGHSDATLRYSTQRQDDHFLVDFQGASGTMARIYSQGAAGRKGKELFRILPINPQLQVRVYPIQKDPVRLVVENHIGPVEN